LGVGREEGNRSVWDGEEAVGEPRREREEEAAGEPVRA
jgi:hypothetical protein